jgi:hypothetical protein
MSTCAFESLAVGTDWTEASCLEVCNQYWICIVWHELGWLTLAFALPDGLYVRWTSATYRIIPSCHSSCTTIFRSVLTCDWCNSSVKRSYVISRRLVRIERNKPDFFRSHSTVLHVCGQQLYMIDCGWRSVCIMWRTSISSEFSVNRKRARRRSAKQLVYGACMASLTCVCLGFSASWPTFVRRASIIVLLVYYITTACVCFQLSCVRPLASKKEENLCNCNGPTSSDIQVVTQYKCHWMRYSPNIDKCTHTYPVWHRRMHPPKFIAAHPVYWLLVRFFGYSTSALVRRFPIMSESTLARPFFLYVSAVFCLRYCMHGSAICRRWLRLPSDALLTFRGRWRVLAERPRDACIVLGWSQLVLPLNIAGKTCVYFPTNAVIVVLRTEMQLQEMHVSVMKL